MYPTILCIVAEITTVSNKTAMMMSPDCQEVLYNFKSVCV